MNYLKTLSKSLILFFIISISSLIIISIFNYFNIINTNITNLLLFISMIISIIIGSFKLGNTSSNKGLIEGLKFGLIISIISIVISLLLKYSYKPINFIYYLILTISSIFGSILGKNKKKV